MNLPSYDELLVNFIQNTQSICGQIFKFWFCRSRAFTIIAMFMVLTSQSVNAGHPATPNDFEVATFSADITIPLNHRCMGVLPTKSKRIADRLYAHGFVLLSKNQSPFVFCAVDWCEIRNGSYEKWRQTLASTADTIPERVFLASLHQHDAPVVDDDAAKLLDEAGLKNELFHQDFHDKTIKRVARLMKDALQDAKPITHFAIGQAKVKQIASNRRVVNRQTGRVTFARGSASGGSKEFADAPDGLIDPWLKTISFWNKDQPVMAMHCYATHPMSYYGRGEVSSDFVGLARLKRQKDDAGIFQIYFSGCSGDVTAGKYNDGSSAMRLKLTDRLYQGMVDAWKSNRKFPLKRLEFKNEKLILPFHKSDSLKRSNLKSRLDDMTLPTEKRILAAMGLASLNRVEKGLAIDFPCLDLGQAKIVLFPGESFVGYQLMAQKLAPDSFVMSIGYGECWPGYIPTKSAFADSFHDNWLWAGQGSEQVIRTALQKLFDTNGENKDASKPESDDYRRRPDKYRDDSSKVMVKNAYVMTPNGTVKNVSPTPGEGFYGGGCIHPDGKDVIFPGAAWGLSRIWRYEIGSGKIVALTSKEYAAINPSYSSDGLQIVFASDKGLGNKRFDMFEIGRTRPHNDGFKGGMTGGSNLFVMDRDGKKIRPLTAGKDYDTRPSFSPDGKSIVFLSSRGANTLHLWTVLTDGTRPPEKLALKGNPWAGRPRYSMDGKMIYFFSGIKDGKYEPRGRHTLCSVLADGGDWKVVSGDTIGVSSHGPDPDSKNEFLWYHAAVKGKWGIFKLPLAGGKPIRVVPRGFQDHHIAHPTTSRNGYLSFDSRSFVQ